MFLPLLLAFALVAATALTASPELYAAVGSAYPGPSALAVLAVAQLAASLAGSLCLGSLVFALCCTRPTAQMRLGARGYAGLRTVERASLVWSAAALLALVTSATALAGRAPWRLSEVDDPVATLGMLLGAYERPQAWLVVAVLAAVVALAARFCLSWVACAVMALVCAVGVAAPWVVENAGEGPGHDYATGAAVWTSIGLGVLFGVSAQLGAAWTEDRATAEARAQWVCGVALIAACGGALVLGLVLVPARDLTGSWYGRLGLVGAVLMALAALAVVKRRFRLAAAAATMLAAVAEAMALQPAPAFLGQEFTASDLLLGFDIPGPPTLWRLASAWRFDVVFGVLAVLAAAAYCLGARRLRQRGDAWSSWRTASFLAGCAFILLVTSSGLGRYGSGQFSYHMAAHMGLNMYAPVFLVLGAPVTLLLRALPTAGEGMAGPREWTLTLIHSRVVQFLAHPLIAVGLFVVSLYGLYFTPLFGLLARYHWGHLLMTAHFLIVGYTYYWAIVGVDPGARRLPHLARLGMLFVVMPFHAFFGVAVLSSNEIIGGRFYRWLNLPWVADLAADQRIAGAIAWTSGEIPIVFVVGALLYQWARADRRAADRSDRRADDYEDDELEAYNAMLAKIAERRSER